MPKRVERKSCVPEAVLLTDGRVETVMLDELYAPYEEQSARLENLCGSFLELCNIFFTNIFFKKCCTAFSFCCMVSRSREDGVHLVLTLRPSTL
jgi:hypothetical protein